MGAKPPRLKINRGETTRGGGGASWGRNVLLSGWANNKNTCVSGSPTDPKSSGPTLNFNFFFFKNPIFLYHKFDRKLTKNG